MNDSGSAATPRAEDAPFLVTTSYEVWSRYNRGEWRLWARPFTEEHLAEAERQLAVDAIERADALDVRIARRTTTVEWLPGLIEHRSET